MSNPESDMAFDRYRPSGCPLPSNGSAGSSGCEELEVAGSPLSSLSYLRLLDQLEQSQLELQRLRQLIHIDELCGIGNRRAFNREMERARALGERHGLTCHLALIDVDGFKDINDRHGHAAGDFILASLALVIKANIRHADALCRVGGDEFAIVFYDIAAADLEAKVVALKRAVAEADIAFDGKRLSLSVSIGCAQITGDAAAAFAAADLAMYRGKRLARRES